MPPCRGAVALGRVAGVADGCECPKDAREGHAAALRCLRAYSGMAGPPADADARSSRGSLASSSIDLDAAERSASGSLGFAGVRDQGAGPRDQPAGAGERHNFGGHGGGGASAPNGHAPVPIVGFREGYGPAEGWEGAPAPDAEWWGRGEAPALVLAAGSAGGHSGSKSGSAAARERSSSVDGAGGALARAGLPAGAALPGTRLVVLDPRSLADVLDSMLEVRRTPPLP